MTGCWHRLAAIGVLIGILAIPLHASAQWNSPGSGAAYAGARQMPTGNVPTTSVTGRNVTVSWSVNSFPGGTAVNGYIVRRYDTSTGTLQTIGTGCSGLIAALNCTENAVPPGTWRYTVQPRHGNWQGTEGATSSSATIGSPTLSFGSSPSITTLPTTLDGTLSDFVTGSTVTYRLDNPVSGALLSGTTTPNPIPNNGNATVSVTIPKATTNGAHVVYAIGDQGDVASAAINVNVTPPTPTTLMLRNNGGPGGTGRPAQGDTLEVTYSQLLDVASVCSTWSGDSTNQSATGDNVVAVTLTNNAAASGNDMLTVATSAAACGGQFHLGSVDLGSPNFVTGTTTFSGAGGQQSAISYDATTFQLVVTLGSRASGGNPARINASLTATYTPDPLITNPSGTPITGTASRTAVQF